MDGGSCRLIDVHVRYGKLGTATIYCRNGNHVRRERRIGIVPLTVKVVDRLTEPARFDAEQAYSPAWRAETPSMMRVLKCLLILVIVILVSFDVSIGTPLKAHDMSMGMSPFRIEQGTDTESPQLAISALKAMGSSCGPTRSVSANKASRVCAKSFLSALLTQTPVCDTGRFNFRSPIVLFVLLSSVSRIYKDTVSTFP